MASYKHRHNLVDLVNQIQVPITTTSQDLTKKGKHHNYLSHITVDAKGKRIPMVLIDDGSALNVCPLKTASFFGLIFKDFVPIEQHVRAYNNSRREVLGIVTLEITIRKMIRKVEFQVLNIASCFNILLE